MKKKIEYYVLQQSIVVNFTGIGNIENMPFIAVIDEMPFVKFIGVFDSEISVQLKEWFVTEEQIKQVIAAIKADFPKIEIKNI